MFSSALPGRVDRGVRPRWVGLVLLALVGAGCSDVCARNSDCSDGLICGAENTCVVPPRDGAADGNDSSDGGRDGAASFDLTPTEDLNPVD